MANIQKNKHKNNHYNKNKQRNDQREDIIKEDKISGDALDELLSDNTDALLEAEDFDSAEDIDLAKSTAIPEEEKSSVMVEVVGIRFKSTGKTYYFAPEGISAQKGSYAIVETARGLEYGEVSLSNTFVSESDIVPPLRPIVRI